MLDHAISESPQNDPDQFFQSRAEKTLYGILTVLSVGVATIVVATLPLEGTEEVPPDPIPNPNTTFVIQIGQG